MKFCASILLIVTFWFGFSEGTKRPSQGVFELRLKNLSGTNSSAAKFRVCLKHFQQKIDPNHECTFGETLTPVIRRKSPRGGIHRFVSFPLDFKWPGTFSLIIEAWRENNQSSDSLISRVATQQWLEAGEDWTQKEHSENRTLLEYEYRVVCSLHYYGKDCDTLCRPRDDKFGHYTCGLLGEKICLPGWVKDSSQPAGDYCTKPRCLPGCHPEHGECDSPNQCKCRTGWQGRLCDECIRYPGCEHGYCNKPYECKCNDGWGGLFCKNDLNYCTNHKPCQNGATCYNTGQGSYTCNCPPGFSGINCEERITNECSHQPCLNGGTCQGEGERNYTCVCPLGFHGNNCEKRAQTCRDFPCRNGGQCADRQVGYVCRCPNGYGGVNCDVKIDICRARAPCLNHGSCIPAGEFSYRCECPVGFRGKNCEENIDDCSSSPCLNSGTCIDLIGDFKCYCPTGFTGNRCEININDCLRRPCANGGTCRDGVNDFICTCPPGYAGRDCSIEINECHSNPCLNDGYCVDRLGDFQCHCPNGYSGKTCNVLPDGTVLASPRSQDDDSGRKALIGALSGIVPTIVIIGVLVVWCQKRRKRQNSEQIRVNADAARENELNTVNSFTKSKMLDDHMIVNSLDFPKQKKINANIADEESFSSKDGSVVYKQMMRDDNKRLNVDFNKCGGASENLLSYAESNRIRDNNSLSSKFDRSTSTLCSGTSGNSSSDNNSNKAKEYGLPTAASISAAAASSKSPTSSSSVYVINERNSKPSSYIRAVPDDLLATEV